MFDVLHFCGILVAGENMKLNLALLLDLMLPLMPEAFTASGCNMGSTVEMPIV